MFEESKEFMKTTGGSRISAAKDTILVIPGIVKIYKSKEDAKAYFADSTN